MSYSASIYRWSELNSELTELRYEKSSPYCAFRFVNASSHIHRLWFSVKLKASEDIRKHISNYQPGYVLKPACGDSVLA